MNGIEKLNAKEREILLDIINSSLSWRLSNGSRKSEVHSLKEVKRKLNLSNETIRAAHREEREAASK